MYMYSKLTKCTASKLLIVIFLVHAQYGIIVITLCTYAQQGYAFGHVGLFTYVRTYVCVCVCVCVCEQKNRLFSAVL